MAEVLVIANRGCISESDVHSHNDIDDCKFLLDEC
jgi:hypothetical protein